MLVLGTLYLIWLAVKILRSTYDTKAVEPKKGQVYLSGLFLQFVNVKVMVSAIVSIQMFVLPYYQSTEALAAFAIFIAIAGTSCNLIWSGFGSVASEVIANSLKTDQHNSGNLVGFLRGWILVLTRGSRKVLIKIKKYRSGKTSCAQSH